jgi:hypothetical protein
LLADCFEEHGLPRNTFFPRDQLQEIIEPVLVSGARVLKERYLSPVEAAERRSLSVDELSQMPSEDERRAAFISECESFADAIKRRLAELQEPGKPLDPDDAADLTLLLSLVHLAIQRTSGRDVKRWRQFLLKRRANL